MRAGFVVRSLAAKACRSRITVKLRSKVCDRLLEEACTEVQELPITVSDLQLQLQHDTPVAICTGGAEPSVELHVSAGRAASYTLDRRV